MEILFHILNTPVYVKNRHCVSPLGDEMSYFRRTQTTFNDVSFRNWSASTNQELELQLGQESHIQLLFPFCVCVCVWLFVCLAAFLFVCLFGQKVRKYTNNDRGVSKEERGQHKGIPISQIWGQFYLESERDEKIIIFKNSQEFISLSWFII